MIDHGSQISISRLQLQDNPSPSSSQLPHLNFLQKYPVDKSKLQPLSSKRKFTKISLPELEGGDSFLNHTIDMS